MRLTVEETLVSGDQGTLKEKDSPLLRTPDELAGIVAQFTTSGDWLDRVRLRSDGRWYERLHLGADHDIWVISWMPGQSTGFHDHGASAGAFVVATGVLEEHRPGQPPLAVRPGEPRAFDTGYAHDVRNNSLGPAVSIHAYSPPLSEMNEYELDGTDLIPLGQATRRDSDRREDKQAPGSGAVPRVAATGIDQVLSAAREKLRRLTPEEANDEVVRRGALLVDIRPEAQRAVEGTIPGALIIERNVLEWRFDPTSSARLEIATNYDLPVIVFCSEGYTSSLAAASLQDLGLWRATDIVGGFKSWSQKQLPIVPPDVASSSP